MLIDELIEKLYELKREYGSQEVALYTQINAWVWKEYNIDEAYYDNSNNLIVIQGKGNTEEFSKPFNNADDFIDSLLEQEE